MNCKECKSKRITWGVDEYGNKKHVCKDCGYMWDKRVTPQDLKIKG
ncbi:unnamed protein product [marine sediment metagenome]|uniref:TFIIB-type domain-containing protein n=1 Tax=marine sediment metagenome TaxID=412755 RepID=X1IKX5_9ZZZZ